MFSGSRARGRSSALGSGKTGIVSGKGDQAGAVDELLELFRRDREWNDGAAKAQLFKLFDSLGPKSEAAQKGRRRLSSMIFA